MKNENFTTIEKSLGNNTISYIGAINKISPKNTAWKFQLFGGITLIDDAKTNHLTKKIGVVTAEPGYLHKLGQ